MSLADSSSLTSSDVLSTLNFIKILRDDFLSPKKLIDILKERRWLRTSKGDRFPGESVLFSPEWAAASQISDIPFIDQDFYQQKILSFKTELLLLGVVVNLEEGYQLVVGNLKSTSCLSCLSAEAFLLILKCMRSLASPDKLTKALKGNKCIKTKSGYRCPAKCIFVPPESEWGCLLQVFSSFPVIDEKFYGTCIFSFNKELKEIGAVVDFEEAAKVFAGTFKQQALLSSIGKKNVLSFVSCYRKLKAVKDKFPSDLKSCIHQVKWLRTRLGDYRPPNECILFGPDWEPLSQISMLPFIDDSENWYGKVIHDYKEELKDMGVVTDINEGARFVATGLYLSRDPSSITPANLYSLLESIKIINEKHEPYPVDFCKRVAKKLLKTSYGYMLPGECLLFDSDWDAFLKQDDGPFIDNEFYGHRLNSYKKELTILGVTVDVEKGCKLLASYLYSHSNLVTISRIYKYLYKFKWDPIKEDRRKIWIPRGNDNGEWVFTEECVLHDKSNLFGLQLNVLEEHYENNLLGFFSDIFGVRVHPSVDDYCKRWKVWEDSGHHISHAECCAFWEFTVNNWNAKRDQETFIENLSKLPVHDPTSDGIPLVDKRNIFIADDLYMKDLFERTSHRQLFVWYPRQSLKSLPRAKLLEVFEKIGARTLSKSVQIDISTINAIELKTVNRKDMFINRGLFRLILSFLAYFPSKFEVETRHEAVNRLLEITVFETLKPMTVGYSLSLSSGDILNVKACRIISWEREDSKILMQKLDRSGRHRNVIEFEYATQFAQVIAEGLLWENEDLVEQLAELIRLGFLVKFEEETIDFLMKTKNLQIFYEDQQYLSSTFPAK